MRVKPAWVIVKSTIVAATNGTFCGNKIVEEGEECDCGYDKEDCEEQCCYPRLVSRLERDRNDTAKMCSRKYKTQCR